MVDEVKPDAVSAAFYWCKRKKIRKMEEKKQDERVWGDEDARRRAVDALLERGVEFRAERRGWLRFWRPTMRLVIQPPTLGVLYAVSGEFATLVIDESRVDEDPIGYSFDLVRSDALSLARAVAYAVLGTKARIKWLGGLYARYLMWQLTANQMLKLVVTVLSVCGTADFINSIRLIKGAGLAEPKA